MAAATPAQSATPVVVALHYQNDVLHPQGRIRVGLGEDDPARARVIDAGSRLLGAARERRWPVVHVRIAFRPDYADLAPHLPIFRRTAEIGAVRDGEWGAEFFEALAPQTGPREFALTHTRISGFFGTPLEALLHLHNARDVVIAGVATHSVVESTVRDAADRGFRVFVAADACAAADAGVHAASLASMQLIAQVDDVTTIVGQLDTEARA